MDFVWAHDRDKKNSQLVFELALEEKCDNLLLCAVDSYQIFLDGKFISYGPERTAKGYSRLKKVSFTNAKLLTIKVTGYNQANYAVDLQLPFFACDVCLGDKKIYSSLDFTCYSENSRIENMPRYSIQRGYVEGYDFHNNGRQKLELEKFHSPKILKGIGERCKYYKKDFSKIDEGNFLGFDDILPLWWDKKIPLEEKQSQFNVMDDFINKADKNFSYIDFKSSYINTGFINLDIDADKNCEVFVVFDEILVDGKWVFRRSACNDFIYLSLPKGHYHILSCEPYTLMHLRVIYNGKLSITPSLIAYQNDYTNVTLSGEKDIDKIIWAGRRTFMQNAVDIFTDCPGRERAGWLCDSYFSAKAERFFTGENTIERAFLENFIIADTPELPKGMIPMCFPSEHTIYIPNWAMWFVLEIEDYFIRTGDRSLVDRAKDKIYELLDFFTKYENEFGLLENLDGWIFIEWSKCNDNEFTKGVNFPSNMLYAKTLLTVASLYNDKALLSKGEKLKSVISSIAYNGEFFVENAVRCGEKLQLCSSHLSQTCQYYALFCGICPSLEYKNRVINDLGPSQNKYPLIAKSNVFIGNYLRFYLLIKFGFFDKAISEITSYFLPMANKTGTIWEHDSPKASLTHGFSSVISLFLIKAVNRDNEL